MISLKRRGLSPKSLTKLAINFLFSTLNEILDQHAPLKTIKVRGRPNPCITPEIQELMKARNYWRKIAKRSNDYLAWAAYKNFKREVKREIRLAEREFVKNQIESSPNNTNSIWKTIRLCLPKKSSSLRTFVKDDKVVAEEFNSSSASVGTLTTDKITSLAKEYNYNLDESRFSPRIFPVSEQFSFKAVENKQVENIIYSMPSNKAPGINKITIRVIKDCLPAILPTITMIINNSFVSEILPSTWKIAEVTPIPKDGDAEQAKNSRPISLLPVLLKVCKRIAHNQFTSYLASKQRLAATQSGNKELHLTEPSLLYTTDEILNAIDKQKLTAVTLLDMSKAFDSVKHKILLLKLQDVGASASCIRWFHNCLSDRFQVVRINSAISSSLPVICGVPQGSIRGPLLFNIYVNDLSTVPQFCLSQSFVDDTKLYLSFQLKNKPQAVAEINQDLVLFRNWCLNNFLLLSAGKSKLVVFGSRQLLSKVQDYSVNLLGEALVPVESTKDLGLTLDENLTFDEHIVKTVSSCMSILYQINRVKHAFDRQTLITVINSLVFSKLFYCSNVWSNTSQKNINKLQVVQNFAIALLVALVNSTTLHRS